MCHEFLEKYACFRCQTHVFSRNIAILTAKATKSSVNTGVAEDGDAYFSGVTAMCPEFLEKYEGFRSQGARDMNHGHFETAEMCQT